MSTAIDPRALFQLSYGLFVLTARKDGGDNGCIINTVTQLTSDPARVSIAVNKQNYTHDLIADTGRFNVSVLSTDATFATFQRYGFQSGRAADKFAGEAGLARSQNGLYYLTDPANAIISGQVISSVDVGTHTLFIADVTEAQRLSDTPSATYAYYFEHIKPKPQASKRKGWVCKICGYVYEGDVLPPDFVCPICKHGAADFEPIE